MTRDQENHLIKQCLDLREWIVVIEFKKHNTSAEPELRMKSKRMVLGEADKYCREMSDALRRFGVDSDLMPFVQLDMNHSCKSLGIDNYN